MSIVIDGIKICLHILINKCISTYYTVLSLLNLNVYS